MLLENNVMPIILGTALMDLDYGQYRGYEDLQKLISFLNIDAFLDLDDGKEAAPSRKHIHKMLLHEPNYLFSYTHLAHQSYLTDTFATAILEKLNFEAHRIGHMRTNLSWRWSQPSGTPIHVFSTSRAVRSIGRPGQCQCTAFWIDRRGSVPTLLVCGAKPEKLSSAGILRHHNSRHYDDIHKKTASVIATMIWYFIEGFYHRKQESNFKSNDFLKYVVSMPVEPETISFYKSKLTEKWWMEVSQTRPGAKYPRNSVVPCSYADVYQNRSERRTCRNGIILHLQKWDSPTNKKI